jgi:hypothetical protein
MFEPFQAIKACCFLALVGLFFLLLFFQHPRGGTLGAIGHFIIRISRFHTKNRKVLLIAFFFWIGFAVVIGLISIFFWYYQIQPEVGGAK